MTLPTQPLRDEHKELLPLIESLKTVADSIGTEKQSSVQQKVEEIYTFLNDHLLVHAQAEERVLYSRVCSLMGAAEATATMSRDHIAIGQLINELGELSSSLKKTPWSEEQERSLRRVLYGLFSLVMVHFAKEEEIYLPLLDARLTAEEVNQLYTEMEAAAQTARHAVRA